MADTGRQPGEARVLAQFQEDLRTAAPTACLPSFKKICGLPRQRLRKRRRPQQHSSNKGIAGLGIATWSNGDVLVPIQKQNLPHARAPSGGRGG